MVVKFLQLSEKCDMDPTARKTTHHVMNPTTPISMETMDRETQSEQMKEGMRTRAMSTITSAVTSTHWIVCGRMARYCEKKGQKIC